MCDRSLYATLIVVVILLAAAMFYYGDFRGIHGSHDRHGHCGRDGYLVYPYLDLDSPGERGSYYAMTDCPR